MDAIVLCGGNGKRMGSLCQDIPKTLIKVRGKPILWFILKSLSRHNVKRVILPVGYKGEKIIQFVELKFSVYINWAIWQKVSLTDGIWLKFEFRAL